MEEVPAEPLTDEAIANEVLRILGERQLRLIELRYELQRRRILVSYARLRRVVEELVNKGVVEKIKQGKAIKYKAIAIKKERVDEKRRGERENG